MLDPAKIRGQKFHQSLTPKFAWNLLVCQEGSDRSMDIKDEFFTFLFQNNAHDKIMWSHEEAWSKYNPDPQTFCNNSTDWDSIKAWLMMTSLYKGKHGYGGINYPKTGEWHEEKTGLRNKLCRSKFPLVIWASWLLEQSQRSLHFYAFWIFQIKFCQIPRVSSCTFHSQGAEIGW